MFRINLNPRKMPILEKDIFEAYEDFLTRNLKFYKSGIFSIEGVRQRIQSNDPLKPFICSNEHSNI